MHSVTSNAVAGAISSVLANLGGCKLFYTNENGGSCTCSAGVFFYGYSNMYYIKIITEPTTVESTNNYWTDPAPGYNKKMIGIYVS